MVLIADIKHQFTTKLREKDRYLTFSILVIASWSLLYHTSSQLYYSEEVSSMPRHIWESYLRILPVINARNYQFYLDVTVTQYLERCGTRRQASEEHFQVTPPDDTDIRRYIFFYIQDRVKIFHIINFLIR